MLVFAFTIPGGLGLNDPTGMSDAMFIDAEKAIEGKILELKERLLKVRAEGLSVSWQNTAYTLSA